MDIGKLPVSKRLLMDAALVPACELLADVGCDHAYTSIYLVGCGVAKRALALDVRPGPLLRAQENIKRYGMEGRIGTRLSDGLCALSLSEADCILICGMGGPLMIDILKRDWDKVLAAKCIVLQPQSEIAQVREFLHKMGFIIDREDMCEEDGKFYTVIRAVGEGAWAKSFNIGEIPAGVCRQLEAANGASGCAGTPKEGAAQAGARDNALPVQAAYQYGASLIEGKHPVLREFVRRELGQKRELERQLSLQASIRAQERLCRLREEIGLLEEIFCRVSK